jgi:hypothetical protein
MAEGGGRVLETGPCVILRFATTDPDGSGGGGGAAGPVYSSEDGLEEGES